MLVLASLIIVRNLYLRACHFGVLTMSMCAVHGGVGSMALSLHPNNTDSTSSYEKKLLQLLRGPLPRSTAMTTTTSIACKAGPTNAFSCITMGSDGVVFTNRETPICRMLSPIMRFISSPDVFQFLKQAETHAGLSNTQLFDLFWVSDNFLNVHGGVRFLFLLASRD